MDNYPRTFLMLLLVCVSCSEGNTNADVKLSDFCVFESCPLHNLTCPNDTRIVIFGEQHAFQYTNGTANDSCTEKCNSTCCQKGNFECFHPVSNLTLSHVFLNCWNQENCKYRPQKENKTFTERKVCESNLSLFGELTYDCIASSSVRDFTDPLLVIGSLVMASFDPSSVAYPPCVRPNASLQCHIESNSWDVPTRVMLVMNASLTGSCPKLYFEKEGYKSPEMSCANAVEFVAFENFNPPFSLTLKLQDSSPSAKAWAVVKGMQPLQMTCGQTCSQSTATPGSSTPQSVTVSTMESRSSPTDQSLTSMSSEFSSTPIQSSSESASHLPSTLTTETESRSTGEHNVTSGESTSTSDPPSTDSVPQTDSASPTTPGTVSTGTVASLPPGIVGTIVGGVIGSWVLLIVIIVVVVVVWRRQQRRESKAAAHEPERGLAVANSAYDDWDLNSGDGEGGTANNASPSVLPPEPAPAPRPVTDVYAKVNKKSFRVASPPSPDSTGPQPGHLPACPASGEVTDVYSRPKKGGKKNPDKEDNSADVTSPEDSSSPSVISPHHVRSSDVTGSKMADNNAPEDKLADYDHLGQKRRPTPQPGHGTYGHLGNKMAADDPEASYDQLRGGGGGAPGPAVLGSHVYGRLGTEGATEEGSKGPYDRLGGAGRRDVIKDGVYHVASDSEHEPNIFEDE